MNIKDSIKKFLKDSGTYKESYESVIDILGDMLEEYAYFISEFKKSGRVLEVEHTNKAGATNKSKSVLYHTLQTLRKDMLPYFDRLGLNPKAFKILDVEAEEVSKLDKLLE